MEYLYPPENTEKTALGVRNMANILTDESRLTRYSVLRKRKKILETIFDISMFLIILAAATEIIPQFISGVLQGFFLGELRPFFVFLGVTLSMAFFVYALFRRDWRFLLPALILSLLLTGGGFFCGLGSLLSPFAIAAALIVSFFWLKLQKEEGFPLFEITFNEEQERQKVQEKRTEYRTLQAQIREAQEKPDSNAEMTDLLDADSQKDFMPAHLSNYHERYRNADAVVHSVQPHDDRMDTVTEPEQSGEMDEL